MAGIFHSRDALVPAVDALLLAGFDRADIDVIVGGSLAREKLGSVHVSIDELPEVPGAPRQPSHEIQIEKPLEDLPLHSLRVAPWLGEEPLGRL